MPNVNSASHGIKTGVHVARSFFVEEHFEHQSISLVVLLSVIHRRDIMEANTFKFCTCTLSYSDPSSNPFVVLYTIWIVLPFQYRDFNNYAPNHLPQSHKSLPSSSKQPMNLPNHIHKRL